MKRTAGTLALVFVLSGCSARGFYVRQGDHTYGVASTNAAGGPFEDDVYEGAYRICKDKHHTGYQILKTPAYSESGAVIEGTFSCEGPINPDLAAKYGAGPPMNETGTDGSVTQFKWGGGL